VLPVEERKLGEMDAQLEELQQDYKSLWDQASGVLARIGSPRSPTFTGAQTTEGSSGKATGTAAAAGGGSGSAAAAAGEGAKGWTGMVYAGLKFSGLAMRVAQDVVTSVKDDAERMMKVSVWVVGWGGSEGCHSWLWGWRGMMKVSVWVVGWGGGQRRVPQLALGRDRQQPGHATCFTDSRHSSRPKCYQSLSCCVRIPPGHCS
jgi:hypothetical protein